MCSSDLKIGSVPFHSWIPDTYHGSPTPVTAFLSIAPKGAAFAILLRMFLVALVTFKPIWTLLLVAASILSMTYGNRVQIGLNVTKATRNILKRMAKAAPLGAIERNAVTGVGEP